MHDPVRVVYQRQNDMITKCRLKGFVQGKHAKTCKNGQQNEENVSAMFQ